MIQVIKCTSKPCINGYPSSKLECPTCHKLGIPGSFFCGQECFKANWKSHKVIHTIAKAPLPSFNEGEEGSFDPWPDFRYTGTLRAMYPLSPKRAVPKRINKPDYAKDGVPKSEALEPYNSIRILNKKQQERMRVVCKMGREILDLAGLHVKPGVTTDEIDEIVHNAIIERNAYPSPMNYREYPKSICTSINEVICHGIPDKRKLREGDILNIDVSVYYDGYHADLNATYPVGKIDDESKMLIRTTRKCLDEAIKVCKPGALFRDIGKAIEPVAHANGCSVVHTFVGHGVHDLFHGNPNIPHYAKNRAVGTMKPGMTFTIEPMINLGVYGKEVCWPDAWTVATADGKRSAQFEETLLITETGVEVLTAGAPLDI
ncbi:methionine aminopeptidase [Schizophyllum commune Tattone D]|nr:methionine aminopeptidase [Schizophyllum commune Tattone D]